MLLPPTIAIRKLVVEAGLNPSPAPRDTFYRDVGFKSILAANHLGCSKTAGPISWQSLGSRGDVIDYALTSFCPVCPGLATALLALRANSPADTGRTGPTFERQQSQSWRFDSGEGGVALEEFCVRFVRR